jgi:hypothetical protein
LWSLLLWEHMSAAENAKQPLQSNVSLTWGICHAGGLSGT